MVYATNKDGDIGTGDFTAINYMVHLRKETNAYVLAEGALRITDSKGYNDGKINYRDIQCHDIQAESIRINSNNNFYVGVSTGELRVTNNLKYNGGNTGYKPVRASDFIKASSAEFKHDIKSGTMTH